MYGRVHERAACGRGALWAMCQLACVSWHGPGMGPALCAGCGPSPKWQRRAEHRGLFPHPWATGRVGPGGAAGLWCGRSPACSWAGHPGRQLQARSGFWGHGLDSRDGRCNRLPGSGAAVSLGLANTLWLIPVKYRAVTAAAAAVHAVHCVCTVHAVRAVRAVRSGSHQHPTEVFRGLEHMYRASWD